MDWGGIPLRVWIVYACLALSGALLTALGVTNSYDSMLAFYWHVKAALKQRDDYKAQIYERLDEVSHFQGLLDWEQHAHYDTRREMEQMVRARDRWHNEYNRQAGTIDSLIKRLEDREADNKELRETNRLLRESLEAH